MAEVVLDWSGARPNPVEVARVARGCVRYLGDGALAGSFNLTPPERDALHGAGVPIALVWEREPDRMKDGPLAGARDAQVAQDQADALGWPIDRPIYFAYDRRDGWDERHLAYIEAARSVSKRPVGAYGPADFLRQLTIRYKWPVATWPGMPLFDACLVQQPNMASPIPNTDVNTFAGDWGGWLGESDSGVPTGRDLLNSAYRFRGEPYSTDPGRTSQTSGFKDCSGLIVAALEGVGITPGGTVSTSLELWAVNSGGHYISFDEALTTPGAGLGIFGYGDNGHIGFSVGDGTRCFETPSAEGHQAGFSPFWRNHWGEAWTWPGINHHGTKTGEDEEMPITIYILDGNYTPQGWIVADGSGYVWIDTPMMEFYRAARQQPFNVKSIEVHVPNQKIAAELARRAGPKP